MTVSQPFAYTTGALGTALDTISYGYGDSSWKDLLTSYDGQALTTDAIGNLTNDGTWSYSWQHGRQLKQMSRPDASGDTEMICFRYDSSGHRIGKDSGVYHASYSGGEIVYAGETTRTSYSYLGDTLTQVNIDAPTGSTSLHFTYDEIGPMSVTYDGAEYFYLKNAQGDVTGLVNSSGTQVVAYTYDAWGNPLTTTGTMAGTLGKLNPFRYRGYVYDTETGLYYLQSRYYNPETGRFINADSYALTGQGVLSGNMFAYCGNNPVVRNDQQGTFFKKIGAFFKKVAKAVKSLITIKKTSSRTIVSQKRTYWGGLITVETGTVTSTASTTQKSVPPRTGLYLDADRGNPLDSSLGITLPTGGGEIDVHIGPSDTGYTRSYGYGDSQMAMGARIDFSDFRTGLVISNTSAVGIQSEVTNYTYISIDGWSALAILAFGVKGVELPSQVVG